MINNKLDKIGEELLATSSTITSLAPNANFLKTKSIVLLGGPGVGKGSQASMLSNYLKVSCIIAGDILRKESERDKTIGDLINSGNFVPDEVINNIIKANVVYSENYIFDGYPRSLGQAKSLDEFKQPKYAIWIDAPDNVLFERLNKRAKSSNRADDSSEAIIKHRIEVYHQTIVPILEYYRMSGRLVRVDGNSSIENVFKQIQKII